MNVGQAITTRDLAPSSLSAATSVIAQPSPKPPAADTQDVFGPATRVAISATQNPAGPAPTRARQATDTLEKVISVDPDTKSLVYQNRNEETGAVVSQYPDEAKLKLRAYFDELAQQQTQAATAGTHLDPSTIDGIRV